MMGLNSGRQNAPLAYYRAVDAGVTASGTAICVIDLTTDELPILHVNSNFTWLFPKPDGGSWVNYPLKRIFPTPILPKEVPAQLRAGTPWESPSPLRLSQPEVMLQINVTPDRPGEPGASRVACLAFRDLNILWQDIQLERERERQRVMMESFGTICHAIGQPMTVLMSGLEMMHLHLIDEGGRQNMLDMCYEAAVEIHDLLQQLNEQRRYATEQYRKTATHADEIIALNKISNEGVLAGLSDAIAHVLTDEPPHTP